MSNKQSDSTELWYRASAKNVVIFTMMWLGEAFLLLKFVKWVMHGSTTIYLLMVPWAIFGLLMVARPNWILRASRAWQKSLERVGENLEKRPPLGFPQAK